MVPVYIDISTVNTFGQHSSMKKICRPEHLKENLIIELSRTAVSSLRKGEASQVECPLGPFLIIFYLWKHYCPK